MFVLRCQVFEIWQELCTVSHIKGVLNDIVNILVLQQCFYPAVLVQLLTAVSVYMFCTMKYAVLYSFYATVHLLFWMWTL